MNKIDLISIFFSIALLIWPIYLYVKKSHLKEARFLAIFFFLSGLWIFFVNITNFSHTAEQLVFFDRICTFFGIIGILSFLFFVYVFHDKNTNLIKSNILIIILALFFSVLTFILPNNAIYNNITFFPDKPPEGDVGNFFIYESLFLLVMVAKSLYVLLRKYKKLSYRKKMQITYVVIGMVFSILGALVFEVILPLMGNQRFYSVGPLSFIFLVGLTSYAIIRHQLLDIKIIIQKGLIYTSLLSIIISFYLLIIFVFGYFLPEITNTTMVISAALVTIIGIFSVPIIEKFFQKITDKIFFKDKYDYSEVINKLSETLNKNINLKILLSQVYGDLKSILKCSSIRIILPKQKLVFDDKGTMRISKEMLPEDISATLGLNNCPIFICSEELYTLANNNKPEITENLKKYKLTLKQLGFFGKKNTVEVVVGVILENELVGLIFLGPKLSGDVYTNEDKKLLETFSYQAAVAIKKAELYEQVIKYSEGLEDRVKKRTAEIKELQEEQKQMMLEISHGLQSPLTVLKGESQFLQKQIPDSEFKTFEKSIDRISKFIYNLLLLAKLESKQNDFKKESVNLSNLLKEIVEYHAALAKNKNIKMDSQIETDVVMKGDKEKLEELIVNLINNAIKYIGNGDKISVSLNKNKKLIIKDNGIGISPDDLPNMFKRFYRAKNKAGLKGTGLGLPICKKIVELHKGTIEVESKVNKGTSFIIKFPEK